jgi:hypothetical protein
MDKICVEMPPSAKKLLIVPWSSQRFDQILTTGQSSDLTGYMDEILVEMPPSTKKLLIVPAAPRRTPSARRNSLTCQTEGEGRRVTDRESGKTAIETSQKDVYELNHYIILYNIMPRPVEHRGAPSVVKKSNIG